MPMFQRPCGAKQKIKKCVYYAMRGYIARRSRPNSKIHDNLLPACLPAFGKRDDVYVGTSSASSAQRTAGQKVGYN